MRSGTRAGGTRIAHALTLCACFCGLAIAQDPERSIEDEVVADVLSQPSGFGTIADLDYPVDYLRRYADRIIRSSFERRFRAVIQNPDETPEIEGPPAPPGIRSSSQPASRPALPDLVKFVDADAADVRRTVDRAPEEYPVGFRARPFGASYDRAAGDQPGVAVDEASRRVAAEIARGLPKRGLLTTLVDAIELMGADGFLAPQPAWGSAAERRLADLGFPVDLLGYLRTPNGVDSLSPTDVARRLKGEGRQETLAFLASCRFSYAPTISGFRGIRDDGGDGIGSLRLQLSRGGDWIGPGDGGAVDIARQLATRLPSIPLFVSIQASDTDEFSIMLVDWLKGRRAPIVVARETLGVSQWAQDNARSGITSAGHDKGQVVTLAPRFACRGEIGALFAAGDTEILHAFSAEGHRCARSPLLFQGGDMLIVHDPAKDEGVLLLGEAEVHRNRALGLTREQVLAAYQAEFGADRCVVLPTISFHIDYEVTLRAVDGKLVAFVNDPLAAAKIIAGEAVAALVRLELLDAATADTARERLGAARYVDFVNTIGGVLIGQSIGAGVYAESFAEKFTSGQSGESGVANFQTILLALDILLNLSLPEDQVPPDRPGAYIRAWRRYAADLAEFRKALEHEGWKVVAVPSVSNGERSLNYLNGLHTPERYYMPATGGLFSALDRAAADAFKAEIGAGVDVIPILTGETQRRGGALRCAVSVLPKAMRP